MIRPAQRDALRRLYHFRCGYCGVSEADSGAELTLDHFQPRSQDGPDEVENLVYCCLMPAMHTKATIIDLVLLSASCILAAIASPHTSLNRQMARFTP